MFNPNDFFLFALVSVVILFISDIQTLLAPITDRYFRHGERLFHQRYLRRNFPDGKRRNCIRKRRSSEKSGCIQVHVRQLTGGAEILQLFSFICLLSFDVYLKKQMIEHMVDELASLAAPSDPKKKN